MGSPVPFVGRAAPEIDTFEAQISGAPPTGQVSQGAQWANTYAGGVYQQATSVVTEVDQDCHEYKTGCYSVYWFEYTPGFEDAEQARVASTSLENWYVNWDMEDGAVFAKLSDVASVLVQWDTGEGYITVDGNLGGSNNLSLWQNAPMPSTSPAGASDISIGRGCTRRTPASRAPSRMLCPASLAP
ncbi:hypothetical protein FOMPIDRAFT_116272 [Fomitopsis schrenkii]|uniref:GH16 domain-containing protein n=1 Tax=Fomitopsis schrenkii TaxID=2126942 RepID=S8E1H7_FOMSC|nr:hypothetical protein FOMPIDRAFT_116272 [Fomitopsis schrenkii]